MSEPTAFEALLRRVRQDDPAAVVELIERYGRAVRTFAHVLRVRLGLSQADMDSEEVQQSVLASFCVRARLGQYELASENSLRALLRRMAHNKAIDYARKGRHRYEALQGRARATRADAAGDEIDVLIKDHLARARALCTEAEWDLIQRRKAGQTWDEIGRACDDRPDTVRKRHERLVDRLGRELGLPGADDE